MVDQTLHILAAPVGYLSVQGNGLGEGARVEQSAGVVIAAGDRFEQLLPIMQRCRDCLCRARQRSFLTLPQEIFHLKDIATPTPRNGEQDQRHQKNLAANAKRNAEFHSLKKVVIVKEQKARLRRYARNDQVIVFAILGFPAITDAVHGVDAIEGGIDFDELFAHAFDVGGDGAVIHGQFGVTHQLIAILDVPRELS